MKPDKILLALAPHLPGNDGRSREWWRRHALCGDLGELYVEPGKTRNAMVKLAAVEAVLGPVSDKDLAQAIEAYRKQRRIVRERIIA